MIRQALIAVFVAAFVLSIGVSSGRAQDAVFIVRHAERLNDSPDSPLSPEGRTRAARLTQMLRDAGISVIYVTEFQRTAQTAQPLADLIKAPLETTPAADTNVLVAKVRALGPTRRALVVTHSDRLPGLLKALGVGQDITVPSSQYDDLFVMVFKGLAAPTLIRLKY